MIRRNEEGRKDRELGFGVMLCFDSTDRPGGRAWKVGRMMSSQVSQRSHAESIQRATCNSPANSYGSSSHLTIVESQSIYHLTVFYGHVLK